MRQYIKEEWNLSWIDWQDKKVYVIVDTTSGEKKYSGIIIDVIFLGKSIEGVDIYLLEMNDKYENKVGFVSNSIKFISEEK